MLPVSKAVKAKGKKHIHVLGLSNPEGQSSVGDFSQFVLPGERGIFPAEILGGPASLSLPPLFIFFPQLCP